jgi:CP family cyanate transporter-like MFS transporter
VFDQHPSDASWKNHTSSTTTTAPRENTPALDDGARLGKQRRGARGAPGTTGRSLVIVALGVILLAVNLRPALVAVSPLLDTIRADTGMSTTMGSLLTTLPLLCFGLLAPLAPRLAARLGMNPTLLLTMAVLIAGTALRLLDSLTALLAGTVVIGLAIAVANVLLPGVIKREFPTRAALMSGVYTMSLFGGAALAAGVTVPVQNAAGIGWRSALGLWGLLAVLGLIVWLPQVMRRTQAPEKAAAGAQAQHRRPVHGVWKHPVAWLVAAYFAAQSLIFYSATAYLPTMLTQAGMSPSAAGWMLSLSSLVAIIGAFCASGLAARRVPTRLLVLVSTALITTGFVGILLAPATATYLWMALLGLGQGSGLSLSVLFMVLRSRDSRHTAQLSSMAQGSGYILAAVGPFALGSVHQATGGWTVPLIALILLAVPTALVGLGSSRRGYAGYETGAAN